MSYDNTNSFVLFKNDRKTSENQPDYTGTITLASGEKMRLAAWIKEGKKGKFMSGKLSEFRDQEQKPEQQQTAGDFDDDLPF